MIEFKAECGHTVRAKDEDAGDVIRCSYCGSKVTVPDSREDNLDFLFRDIEPPTEPAEPSRRRKRGWLRQLAARRRSTYRRFDPFAVILRMCYGAALIIIVIFIGDKYVLPLFREGNGPGRIAGRPQSPAGVETPGPTREPPVRHSGLILREGRRGLYVASTPPGAAVFCVEASKAPDSGRIQDVEGCIQTRANGPPLRLPDGTYVVEVVLPWNDPSLSNPELPDYAAYRRFRRALEPASDEERRQLLESFFVPDEADPVFIDQTQEQIYIVRQYRGVRIRNGQSAGVRALFLPRIARAGGSFAVAPLVAHYLPQTRAYAFDEKHIRNELEFYDVPVTDRRFVVEALARIGIVPYVMPDGRTRLFKIGIHDGVFAAKVIREAGE